MYRRSGSWIVITLVSLVLTACGANTVSTAAPTSAPIANASTSTSQLTSAPASEPEATSAPILAATAASPTSSASTQIKVVTTMSILADMVKQVGGDRVTAQNIIPIGAGPEDYQPTPQDAQTIAQPDIVFFNGHGLEEWLDDLFKSAGKQGQPQIAVSEDLQAVDVGSADFKEGNPHFWMDATYGAKYVEKIRDGLIQIDPAGKEAYMQRADAYSKELLALNDQLKQQAATLPADARKMVTNHDAFPYFAKEYGFTIVGNVLGNPEAEPSAGEFAQLVKKIKDEHVKAVFSESQFSPKLTKSIADEAGVQVVSNLYTDTLGDDASGVTSYADMLRYDMKTIVDALK